MIDDFCVLKVSCSNPSEGSTWSHGGSQTVTGVSRESGSRTAKYFGSDARMGFSPFPPPHRDAEWSVTGTCGTDKVVAQDVVVDKPRGAVSVGAR